MRAVLEVDQLTKRFDGFSAVDRVSFRVERGEILGLIGPNGSGKSTTFNVIAGLYPPTSGSIRLDGQEIGGLAPNRICQRGIARTFQIPRPFPAMTVLDNVMLAPTHQLGETFWANWLRPGAVAKQEIATREAARHWIDFVGLSALEQQPARVLSGGQRKLLELARVMVAQPKLVLLDEPGAGVNPTLLDQIVDKIGALNRQGVTFLIVEHNMDVVISLCHSVMVMAQGQLLVHGQAREVLRDARVVEAYLGAPQQNHA